MDKFWPLHALAALLLTAPLHADEPAPPEPPTAVVPYDPAVPIDGQQPSRMYLDYDAFQRLWKTAKENRAHAETKAASAIGERGATVSSALHSLRVEPGKLVGEARYSILTRGPDWVVVPFAWSGASPRSLTVDGALAAVRDGQLIIEKPGTHTVVVEYEVPLPAGWTEAAWTTPVATATALALKLAMDDPARPEINHGAPVVESLAEGGRLFTATLGRTDRILLRRQLATGRAGGVVGDPSLVTFRERLYVTSALERLEASATFTFAGQDRRAFTLRLDPTLTPVSIDIPGLRTWSLRKEAGTHTLDFELVNPARDTFTAHMVAERPVAPLPATLSFPTLAAAAGRAEREITFLVTDELELRPHPEPQWRQIATAPLSDQETGGFVPVGTFAGSGIAPVPAYSLQTRAVERLATTSYVFQISPGKFEIIAGLQLRPAAGDDLLESTVRLPDGLTVQGVAGERLTDWWREGDALRLRFGGTTPEVTAVTLNLTRPLAADATEVAFTPLPIDGFSKIDGSGLLIAPLGVDASLAFDQPSASVRETSPEAANRGFTVLLPFEIKRGFTFDTAGWSAVVRLAPITPQFDADWVLDAEVHEGFVALYANLLVRIRQGALSAVSFTLPSSLPEMEVHGEDVREVTSVVDGALRRYTAALQRETNSPLLLSLSGELAHPGRAEMPDLDLPGATRIERFVIIENKSDGRLDLLRSGLTECPRGQLSFLPQELADSQIPAQFFSAQPGWAATVVVEPLATTTGQAAVVLEADLTTSLLRNGEEWVRAAYRLHNRSLQFFPVALPAGAQLVSVTVAGQSSRADQGVVNGRPVTLIPLIQTRPGERSVEVSLVYRLSGPPPVRGVFERTLDDPDLPGLSVQQTLWTVQLPDGYHLRTAKGPMTRIEAESLDAEKWMGRLAESASLISLSSNQGYDDKTKQDALYNSSQLLSELKDLERSGKLSSRDGAAYAQVAEEFTKQQAQLRENQMQVAQEKPSAEPTNVDGRRRQTPAKKYFSENNLKLNELPNQQSAPAPPDASQLAINDNVFWQYRAPATDSGDTTMPSKPESQRRLSQLGKLDATPSLSFQTDTIQTVREIDGPLANERANHQQAVPPAGPAPTIEQGLVRAASDLNRNFANSRINGALQLQNEAPGQNPEQPNQPTAPPPATTPTAQPASGPGPDLAARPASAVVAASATLDRHLALSEVFPAQSNAVHFKKIKDRAVIEVVASEPRLNRHRLTHLGMFLGLVALTIAGDRCRTLLTNRPEKPVISSQ